MTKLVMVEILGVPGPIVVDVRNDEEWRSVMRRLEEANVSYSTRSVRAIAPHQLLDSLKVSL